MQSMRNKLKKVKITEHEGDGVPLSTKPSWSVGYDVPVTWSKQELKNMKRRILRDNYKRGVISKEVYKNMI